MPKLGLSLQTKPKMNLSPQMLSTITKSLHRPPSITASPIAAITASLVAASCRRRFQRTRSHKVATITNLRPSIPTSTLMEAQEFGNNRDPQSLSLFFYQGPQIHSSISHQRPSPWAEAHLQR